MIMKSLRKQYLARKIIMILKISTSLTETGIVKNNLDLQLSIIFVAEMSMFRAIVNK